MQDKVAVPCYIADNSLFIIIQYVTSQVCKKQRNISERFCLMGLRQQSVIHRDLLLTASYSDLNKYYIWHKCPLRLMDEPAECMLNSNLTGW